MSDPRSTSDSDGKPPEAACGPFDSLYTHGFVRVAACAPTVRVADPASNVAGTLALARQASDADAAIAVFPELGLSAYTNDDLFFQDALLDGVERALAEVVEASRDLFPALLVGAPLRAMGGLYNCAVVVHRGAILGVVPKTFLPNYREFYEKRYFASGAGAPLSEIYLLGREVPFGSELIFAAEGRPDFALHVEICEDLWAPVPPSTYGAVAGATILANLSASNITVGKSDYRRLLCRAHSGRCIAGYIYAASGPGESTTDLAWDGHLLICENAEMLTEGKRFPSGPQMITADIDLDRLRQERTRMTSYIDNAGLSAEASARFRRVPFRFEPPAAAVPLKRFVARYPYVPADNADRDDRCREVYEIQVQGLATRLQATGIKKAVIGVSGGLDSTQALLVTVQAFDRLGLPRENVLAYTLPGFGTSGHTRGNAWKLMEALGVSAGEIDIRPSAEQRLRELGHPAAEGKPVYDITYENVQAGERTSLLFRLANMHNGLVIGTGDLSELALGWMTYGVGDQMSHYAVNASVPKTLMIHLIRWVVLARLFNDATSAILTSIADTDISPELIPGEAEDKPHQKTEETIGPYALHDFSLYYFSRFGLRPSKIAYLALHAWGDAARGVWPETVAAEARHSYPLPVIKKWMESFIVRFFQTSQFKRTAMPNGPKVGSGGSLSPRGDWRAPSDSSAQVWLDELRRNVP